MEVTSSAPLIGTDAVQYVEKRLLFPMEMLKIFPKYFLIETINKCNARCVMCGINFDNKVKTFMSDELFDKIVTEVGQYHQHVEKIMLYLDGEPLMDKGIVLKIKKMKSAGIKTINLASNASLLTPEKSEEILKAGLDQIYLAMDSLKEDVFEKIRVGLNFRDVFDHINKFIELRDKIDPKCLIRLQMVLQELNGGEEDEFKRFWTSRLKDSDQVVVTKAHNWASKVETKKFGDESDVNHIPCIAIFGTMSIHADGSVGLCCMDCNNDVLIGDVQQQSIQQIWTGEIMEKMREKHLSGKRHEIPICDGCTLWRETKHSSMDKGHE